MTDKSISIYVHIPFCAKKCRYCDFYSINYSNGVSDDYIDALALEWGLLCKSFDLAGIVVDTLYFGGGTPSILSIKQWEKIYKNLISKLNLKGNVEFSVECNPESFSPQKASVLKGIGVTRLTFGIQSLSDRELSFSGRVHNSQRALDTLNSPILSGFVSIGADLIYGLPGQTIKTFKETVNKTLTSPFIKHLSAYELTINDQTPFGKHRKILPLPPEDETVEMMQLVRSESAKHCFEQYEISNFSKPHFRSRHNEAYWDHQTYIGLGCAAHSYLHPQRWSNKADVLLYMKRIANKELPLADKETLSSDTIAQEMIFLGLRRVDGINENRFEDNTGTRFTDRVNNKNLQKFISLGWLVYEKPLWKPTREGLLFADGMASELM